MSRYDGGGNWDRQDREREADELAHEARVEGRALSRRTLQHLREMAEAQAEQHMEQGREAAGR